MIDQIIHGDCIKLLPTLSEDSVDLVFADPPYYLQLKGELWRPDLSRVDAVDDAWDQFESFAEYDAFTVAWLKAVRRVMKPNATIWVSGTYHNIFRVGRIMQDIGFWLLNTVTWHRTNAMPNFRGTRLKNDVEFVIWAKYDAASRYTFNYHDLKQDNGGKQMGSVWSIPVTGGAERLRDSDGNKLHSTQKPEALLQRIIRASSRPDDVVLDPFVGSGTTAAVARRLHRHWIGVDSNPVYVAAARQRVANTSPLPDDNPLWQAYEAPVRVPFAQLLEQGYLQPDTPLYFGDTGHQAVVLDNGSIQSNGYVGSIHQVGRHLTGLRSCNGWTHWYYVDPDSGEKRVLDTLRQQVRREMQTEQE